VQLGNQPAGHRSPPPRVSLQPIEQIEQLVAGQRGRIDPGQLLARCDDPLMRNVDPPDWTGLEHTYDYPEQQRVGQSRITSNY